MFQLTQVEVEGLFHRQFHPSLVVGLTSQGGGVGGLEFRELRGPSLVGGC